jgi:hypothetical protein
MSQARRLRDRTLRPGSHRFLAAIARRRLPSWSDQIFVGNVMNWQPPSRFDYVRTELEYVPTHRRRAMAERLLRTFLLPGGRLIPTSYGSSRRSGPQDGVSRDVATGWSYELTGESEAVDTNGGVVTRVAWTGVPG